MKRRRNQVERDLAGFVYAVNNRSETYYRKKIVAEIREAFDKFPMDIVCLTLHGKSVVYTILDKAEKVK